MVGKNMHATASDISAVINVCPLLNQIHERAHTRTPRSGEQSQPFASGRLSTALGALTTHCVRCSGNVHGPMRAQRNKRRPERAKNAEKMYLRISAAAEVAAAATAIAEIEERSTSAATTAAPSGEKSENRQPDIIFKH